MLEPLKVAVGENNVEDVRPESIGRQFNQFVENRVIVVSELSGDRERARSIYNNCKIYWASPPTWVPMELKGQDPTKAWNGTAWVMTTNEIVPLSLDKDDRRICMVSSDAEPLPDSGKSIWEWYGQGGLEKAAQ